MTKTSLVAGFRKLGLREGQALLVHSSLSRIGWVCGGPVAVVQALMELLGEAGTLVMPTHSGDYSEPAKWTMPPVPQHWWETIRREMPAFDPQVTPTRGMGAIPECFRTFPGVRRSSHPMLSFAAWGKEADFVTRDHSLAYGLGERSPLARLYELDAFVLLLGVGYDSNTSFHLAENRLPSSRTTWEGAPIIENGVRVWKSYPEIAFDTDRFEEIGEHFERERGRDIVRGRVGAADVRLFRIRDSVDYAQQWLEDHPLGEEER